MNLQKHIHYDRDLEMAIIGACLLEGMAMGRIYGSIEAETFYSSGHQEVYRAMKEMYDNSAPIDILTVTEWIVRKGITDLEGSNVPYFVTRTTYAVVGTTHLEYHCYLIKEMWRRRKILEIKFSAFEDESDTGKNLYDLHTEINKITSGGIKKDWYAMDEIIFNLMKHQSEMVKGTKSFVTTGFKKADHLNGGFYNGQMIVIGARPSVGKSALMGQMALKMAREGKKVGIISLEMNNNEIAARLSSIETGIDFSRIYRDIANDELLHKRFYDKVSKDTINLPIFLSDKTKVNVHEIRAKATKLKATRGCDCLMIDYLQLIDSSTENRNYNREQEVAQMSRGLKLMAQELDIPVIVLCQLNRQVTHSSYADRFPKLSHLRESGSIEQDADVVMFIHRDYVSGWQVDDQGASTENKADLIAAKWRNGATFHLELDFDPPKMKFSEKGGFVPVPTNFQDDNPF
jgi:replicative DNA helicase